MNISPVRRLLFLYLTALVLSATGAEKSLVVVANSGDSTVSIYAATHIGSTGDASLAILKVLPTGKTPNEVCISPDGKRAYVTNRGENSVTVLDLDAVTVASTISEPGLKNPDGCTVDRTGAKLYVAAAGQKSVFVFSTADGHKLAELTVGEEPRRLLFSPDANRLYVSNGGERFLSVIDPKTDTVIERIKAGRDPRAMAFTPDGRYLAISNVSDDTVQFVKPGETAPEFVVGVPKSPQRLVLSPAKQLLFAIGRVDNVIAILDVRPMEEFGRVVSTLPVGHLPWGMALSAAGDSLYVTNTSDNTISVVDLRLMRTTFSIPTGKGPLGIALR